MKKNKNSPIIILKFLFDYYFLKFINSKSTTLPMSKPKKYSGNIPLDSIKQQDSFQ